MTNGLREGRRVVLPLALCICHFAFAISTARACLRENVDRRAVQWSDAIVLATLKAIDPPPSPTIDHYSFVVSETFDGPLRKDDVAAVEHCVPPVQTEPCAGRLSKDDLGKSFVVLLRKVPTGWQVVTIGARDGQDPTARDALKQLIAETRKADAAVTADQAALQARTLSDAQDDTEADQAEQALEEMGPRAAPGIRIVLEATSPIGKTRLKKVLADILPPAWANESRPTTAP